MPKPRWRLASSLLVSLAVSACAPEVEVRLTTTGAFNTTGDAVLLLQARYRTTTPDVPAHAASESSRDWRLAFVRADGALGGRSDVRVVADLAADFGGGALYGGFAWVEATGLAFTHEYGRVRRYELATGAVVDLVMPRDTTLSLFGDVSPELQSSPAPDEGLSLSFAVSPDGQRVAVFYTVAFEGPGGALDLRFVHAVAFFTAQGQFQGAVRLIDWDRSQETLALRPPALALPASHAAPQPPAVARYEVPSPPVHLLWTKDGSAVVLADVDRDDQGAVLATSLAVRVDAATRLVSQVTEVPQVAIASTGGLVAPDGRALLRDTAPGASLQSDVVVVPQTGAWTAFDQAPLVPLAQAAYAH